MQAKDGMEAMRIAGAYGNSLSLILLDLLMPEMDGYEVLRALSHDASLKRIPVMVLTSEKSAEVQSLALGAVDFIPKPYDAPEIIRARVKRAIQWAEDSATLQDMEHDDLTSLYTARFFYKHAERIKKYDHDFHKDAIVFDVHTF